MKINLRRHVLTSLLFGGLLAFFMLPSVVHAARGLDREEAYRAWEVLGRLEIEKGMPKGLLHAISLVETGLGVDGHYLPWPYTINVNSCPWFKGLNKTQVVLRLDALRKMGFRGFDVRVDGKLTRKLSYSRMKKHLETVPDTAVVDLRGRRFSKYFRSKDEAVKAVTALHGQGIKNTDLGLMQVNWIYHGENFASISDAFDPYKNASYAVSYLNKHRATRDWWGSVGRYHSGTGKLAKNYVRNVWEMYKKIHRLKG